MRIDRRWLRRVLVVALLAGIGLAVLQAFSRWDPDSLGPRLEHHDAPPALAANELRVVTWNAWRLHAPERVPGLVRAIDEAGAALASGAPARPELVAIQEIESEEAGAALARELGEDGFFATCTCARQPDGALRSAVGAAVRRPLEVRAHECIDLARIVPDHPRCALLAHVTDAGGRELDFVAVHMAWHFANWPMADRLRRALRAQGALGAHTVLAGDLNAWPGTESFERLASPPLRDARPGAPPTFFLGWRLDAVLLGDALEPASALDRRWSYDTFDPAARWTLPRACADGGPPECPISDHLPEGVVLRWREE